MDIRSIALASILGLVIPVQDAAAQQAQRVYRVGILGFGSAAPSVVGSPINERLTERLRELGFRLHVDRAQPEAPRAREAARPRCLAHGVPAQSQPGQTGLELTQKAAASLGVTVRAVEVRSPKELGGALASVAAQRPDVLLVYPDALTMIYRKEIVDFALKQRLPAVFAYKEFAEAGGLISYGSTLQELGDRAAELTARILRGAKAHDLPLQQARAST